MCQPRIMQNEHALAVWRKSNKYSQEDFADKIGVSRWMVNSIETGRRRPSLDLALKIQIFTENKVSPAELVTTDAPIATEVVASPKKKRDAAERETVA